MGGWQETARVSVRPCVRPRVCVRVCAPVSGVCRVPDDVNCDAARGHEGTPPQHNTHLPLLLHKQAILRIQIPNTTTAP